jgi:hypothetical protein
MLGSFDAANPVRAKNSAEQVRNNVGAGCAVTAQAGLSDKIMGFPPGFVSVFLGPYDTHADAAASLKSVLPCMPKAFMRSVP